MHTCSMLVHREWWHLHTTEQSDTKNTYIDDKGYIILAGEIVDWKRTEPNMIKWSVCLHIPHIISVIIVYLFIFHVYITSNKSVYLSDEAKLGYPTSVSM